MACVELTNGVTVCGFGEPLCRRRVLFCPTCKRRRRFVETFGGIYYANTLQCVGCGDQWGEGGRMERPFKRGWRKEAIARAQRDYYSYAVDVKTYNTEVSALIYAELRAA